MRRAPRRPWSFRRAWACALGVALLAPALGGCAGREAMSSRFEAPAGSYDEAFDAARRALREMRFELDRVDAAQGVITTRAKGTSGLATPWDVEQSTLADEWRDFVNAQRRYARVTFAPAGAGVDDEPRTQAAPGRPPVDLRTLDAPIVGEVLVVVERVNRPHWRVFPVSTRRSSFARDQLMLERRIGTSYGVARTQDKRLAGRLAERVREQIATPSEAAQASGG